MNSCRCCNWNIGRSDLYSKSIFLGKEEVYSVMIQECFGITLTSSKNNSICDSCVLSLRNAVNFKMKILQTEKMLMQSLQENQDNLQSNVKKEEIHDYSDFKDAPLFELDMLDVENEKQDNQIVSIKTELEEKKSLQHKHQNKNPKASENNKTTKRRNVNRTVVMKLEKKPIKLRSITKIEHMHNLQTILNCSNAVLFKNKTLYGYVCGYCNKQFPDPADLRHHKEIEHKNDLPHAFKRFEINNLIVKLDVTDLICTLCQEKMEDLTTLKEHLVRTHKKIFNNIEDHIMQFKLHTGEKYDCALCPSTHETFKMLKQHMNVHYNNYVCEKCGTPFVNSDGLRKHELTHPLGNFKCGYCDKNFASHHKKNNHEKAIHSKKEVKVNRKCPHCNELFKTYYQRNQHMVKEHGSDMNYKCNVCSRAFLIKQYLMKHIKRYHLMERNYQCTKCALKFFNNGELIKHMVKHTGEKSYRCEVCTKSYGRKNTLREHMRIHNNDRRFKCEVCLKTFVQKCSLKGHLLTNHRICLNTGDIKSGT